MKKFIPFILVLILLGGAGFFLLKDEKQASNNQVKQVDSFKLENFNKIRSCARLPEFLYKAGVKRPIIDLSQQQYRGVAFYYGVGFKKALHKKEWERFDALGTYTLDSKGNMYLTPNPYISIKPTTFNLQKAIYRLDSISGKLDRWMVIDDITPNQNNPFGLISIVYDCQNKTLWASSIDKSDYKSAKGRIYHIEPKTKEILGKVSGFDALTLAWVYGSKSRYLLAGNARDNGVYAFEFKDGKIVNTPYKLFELPNPRLRVRKIKVIAPNKLKIEAIKFNYSLIAETTKKQRIDYIVTYKNSTWHIITPSVNNQK